MQRFVNGLFLPNGTRLVTSTQLAQLPTMSNVYLLRNRIVLNREEHTVSKLIVENSHRKLTVARPLGSIAKPRVKVIVKIIPFVQEITDRNEGEECIKNEHNRYVFKVLLCNTVFKKFADSYCAFLEGSRFLGLKTCEELGIDMSRCVPINNCVEIINNCKVLYPESRPVLGFAEDMDKILNNKDRLAAVWLDFNGTLDGKFSSNCPSFPYDAIYKLFQSGKLLAGSSVMITLCLRAGNRGGVTLDQCRDESIGMILRIVTKFGYTIESKKIEQYGTGSKMLFWHFQITGVSIYDDPHRYFSQLKMDQIDKQTIVLDASLSQTDMMNGFNRAPVHSAMRKFAATETYCAVKFQEPIGL